MLLFFFRLLEFDLVSSGDQADTLYVKISKIVGIQTYIAFSINTSSALRMVLTNIDSFYANLRVLLAIFSIWYPNNIRRLK